MATSLSLGSLSTTGGAPRLFGTSSQIDTETLVKAAYEAKRAPAVRLERKIADNEAKAAAFTELRGLLEELRSALTGLRNPPGALGSKENLFEAKEAYLSSSTATDPGTLLGIDVDQGAALGQIDMVVERLATAEKQSSASVSGTGTTLAEAWNGGTAFAGGLLIGLAGGTPQRVAIDGGMTVHDLRDAINAVSRDSGVTASVVKVADGDHRLILTGAETGRAITLGSEPGGDDVLAKLGLTSLQAARTSRLLVDGMAVERSGNTIADLYEGVTISLFKADPDTTVGVGIEPALGTVKEGVRSFVDAYNAVRDFVSRHSALDSTGKVEDGAVLFGDRVLRSLSTSLATLAGGRAAGAASSSPATLRAIGISFDAENRLDLDESALDRKLLADLPGVRGVLEFGLASSSADLRVLARSNALADTSFTVAIVDDDGDGVPESASFDGVAAEISGSTLKGAVGTAYEGLALAWVGQGSGSIDVEVTQGIADQLFNAVDAALDAFEGPLAQAIEDLEASNETYRQQIAVIDERAEAARTRLIERFSAMETALSLANAMMEQVRAQIDAMTADS